MVDDQEHMRELLVEALSADGHTGDPAEDGGSEVSDESGADGAGEANRE